MSGRCVSRRAGGHGSQVTRAGGGGSGGVGEVGRGL